MQEILKTLELWCEPGQVYELRVADAGRKKTISGYFDDLEALAREAEILSDDSEVKAVYLTLNPVNPDLLARANNRTIPYARVATTDADILHRRLLYVDCDPERSAGISASPDEHDRAMAKTRQVIDFLTMAGFPAPILGDSGNGGHALYGVNLPNSPESTALVKQFLATLANRFNDPDVNVDQSVCNAARISKLYGTWVRKGDNTPARPGQPSRLWRKSAIIEAPERLEIVPVELLEDVAQFKPVAQAAVLNDLDDYHGPHDEDSVVALIESTGLEIESGPHSWNDGLKWRLEECIQADEHSGPRGDAIVTLINGCVGYKCLHAHCCDLDAKAVFGQSVNAQRQQQSAVNTFDDLELFEYSDKSDKSDSKPEKKTDPQKFDKLATAFTSRYQSIGQNIIYTNGRTYFYDFCRYVECEELPMKVREFFKAKGYSQSNNVIGNVVPIIHSYSWRDASKVGRMPFWDGENPPFSSAKNIIAFLNGLMDIAKNDQKLTPHSSKWCSTFCLPFAYDPKATCPQFLNFLNEIFEGDRERMALVQEFFGYCLTPDTSLQKSLLFVGKARSGKGTLQRILGWLIGPENSTGYSLERLATEFGPSALVDKSVALVGEVELSANPHRAKIVEVLKSIIGEDSISINTKYDSKYPSLRLPTRFVIASNSVPRLLDPSGALGYRFLFVPFEVSFVGREDTQLEEKLISELPGIANWALAGLARLRKNGGKFTTGASHLRLSAQYAADTSPILAWLTNNMVVNRVIDPGDLPESCLTDGQVSISKADAFANYQGWCEANNTEAKSQSWFGKDLGTFLPKLKEGRQTLADGSRPWIYRNLGLRPVISGTPQDETPEVEEATAPSFDKERRQRLREARNLRFERNDGTFIQPDPDNMTLWQAGRRNRETDDEYIFPGNGSQEWAWEKTCER